MSKKFTVQELLEWFIRYRRFVTGDSIDPIGNADFEKEFANFIYYLVNNHVPTK